jgi:hypothetical protein
MHRLILFVVGIHAIRGRAAHVLVAYSDVMASQILQNLFIDVVGVALEEHAHPRFLLDEFEVWDMVLEKVWYLRFWLVQVHVYRVVELTEWHHGVLEVVRVHVLASFLHFTHFLVAFFGVCDVQELLIGGVLVSQEVVGTVQELELLLKFINTLLGLVGLRLLDILIEVEVTCCSASSFVTLTIRSPCHLELVLVRNQILFSLVKILLVVYLGDFGDRVLSLLGCLIFLAQLGLGLGQRLLSLAQWLPVAINDYVGVLVAMPAVDSRPALLQLLLLFLEILHQHCFGLALQKLSRRF